MYELGYVTKEVVVDIDIRVNWYKEEVHLKEQEAKEELR